MAVHRILALAVLNLILAVLGLFAAGLLSPAPSIRIAILAVWFAALVGVQVLTLRQMRARHSAELDALERKHLQAPPE